MLHIVEVWNFGIHWVYISKGEHGIKILCPNPRIDTFEIKDKYGNLVLDENGEPKKKQVQYVTFSIGNTFDISQTFGKELKGKDVILQVEILDDKGTIVERGNVTVKVGIPGYYKMS